MVRRLLGLLAAAITLIVVAAPALAETRVALVLGSGSYQTNPLPSALNSAGLVAQTLRDLGFSTVEGADLPQSELRGAVANFLTKVREAGPDSIVFVYLAGVGLQHESDSYLIPSDTTVEREADIPIGGIRLADLTRALASLPAKAKVVLLDLSNAHPYANVGEPVRPGLGVIDGGAGMLIASAAAPGQVVTLDEAAYSRFSLALAEQLREPGVPVDQIVARARLRVHQQTNGRDTPWEVSALVQPAPVLTLPTEMAAAGTTPPPVVPLAERPMTGLPVQEAYALAIEQDTIAGYQAFLRLYPDDALSPRIKRLLAAKREALVWRQTVRFGSSQAYWTYLRRYPRGPHADEARWRLGRLSAPVAPPAAFEEVVYDDIPPPLPVIEVIDDPVYWEPAPAVFYDSVALAPVYLGPPVAPIWSLPAPAPYVWGALPIVAGAAIVAAPFVLPRIVRPPVAPVVLRPPPGGPRWGLPGGQRPGGPVMRPLPGGQGGPVLRPLPGGPGGAALPPGAGRPPLPQGQQIPPVAGRPPLPQGQQVPPVAGKPQPNLPGRGQALVNPNLNRPNALQGRPRPQPGGPMIQANRPPRPQGNVRPAPQRPVIQNRVHVAPRMNVQRANVQPRVQAPRMSAPRMSAPPRMAAPRMSAPPRMAAPRMSAPRPSGNTRRRF